MSSVGVMFDLDAILDTRLGNIKLNQPKVFEEIENSPKYHQRGSDEWKDVHPALNHSELTLSYQGRDLNTIKASQITPVIRAIIDTVGNIKSAILSGDPEVSGLFFVMNIHPYKLDKEYITEIARFAVNQLGYPDIQIGYIDLPYSKITLDYLRENNILHWYCYHYQEWMSAQFDNPILGEEQTKIDGFAECKLYCPKISSNQKQIDELMGTLLEEIDVDQFAMSKIAFSSVININYLPTSTFSRLDVKKLIQAERGDEMERSNVINVFYDAVEEVKYRQGEEKVVDYKAVDEKIEALSPRLIELQALNQPSTMPLFRIKLAEFMIETASMYKSTPFSPGDDLEHILNHMSLKVDTTVDEFLATEQYWNNKGYRTIRREYRLSTGELIYRCINEEDDRLLEPVKNIKLKLPAIDDLILGNYFRGQVYGQSGS